MLDESPFKREKITAYPESKDICMGSSEDPSNSKTFVFTGTWMMVHPAAYEDLS